MDDKGGGDARGEDFRSRDVEEKLWVVVIAAQWHLRRLCPLVPGLKNVAAAPMVCLIEARDLGRAGQGGVSERVWPVGLQREGYQRT